jgi:predicted MPP superfamily phosphohydrolase
VSVIRALVAVAVVVLVVGLLARFLWVRLIRDTTAPGRVRRRSSALLGVLAALPFAALLFRGRVPHWIGTPLEWVAFSWLGLAFYLVLTLLVLEPVRWALRARLRRRTPAPVAAPAAPCDGTARRVFLARSLAVTAGAVALETAGTGAYLANAAPVVRRVPVTLAGLDPALDGLRIVTFSDGHLSATYGGRRFERLVEIVNAQRPDVVAIVADLVDGDVDDLREDVAPLADLVSDQGVFFVTGNHEYFVDTTAWLRHLPTLGVQVLRNERVPIGRGGATFDLAGIDDRTAASSGLAGHGADLDAALDGRDDATPVVLLAHQPVMVEQARAAGVDLQLSGHTHGGQLWPFDYAVRLDQPAVQGWSRHGGTQLYVTPGAGYWGPPMRVGARPEVTVVELRSP